MVLKLLIVVVTLVIFIELVIKKLFNITEFIARSLPRFTVMYFASSIDVAIH